MIRKIVISILVLAVGAWYFLVLDHSEKKDLQHSIRSEAREVQSKVQTLTVPRFQAGSPEAAALCRENLLRIASAKRRAEGDVVGGQVSVNAVLREMNLGELPLCPSGGSYTIGPPGFPVKCSIGANGTTRTDDDHIISQ